MKKCFKSIVIYSIIVSFVCQSVYPYNKTEKSHLHPQSDLAVSGGHVVTQDVRIVNAIRQALDEHRLEALKDCIFSAAGTQRDVTVVYDTESEEIFILTKTQALRAYKKSTGAHANKRFSSNPMAQTISDITVEIYTDGGAVRTYTEQIDKKLVINGKAGADDIRSIIQDYREKHDGAMPPQSIIELLEEVYGLENVRLATQSGETKSGEPTIEGDPTGLVGVDYRADTGTLAGIRLRQGNSRLVLIIILTLAVPIILWLAHIANVRINQLSSIFSIGILGMATAKKQTDEERMIEKAEKNPADMGARYETYLVLGIAYHGVASDKLQERKHSEVRRHLINALYYYRQAMWLRNGQKRFKSVVDTIVKICGKLNRNPEQDYENTAGVLEELGLYEELEVLGEFAIDDEGLFRAGVASMFLGNYEKAARRFTTVAENKLGAALGLKRPEDRFCPDLPYFRIYTDYMGRKDRSQAKCFALEIISDRRKRSLDAQNYVKALREFISAFIFLQAGDDKNFEVFMQSAAAFNDDDIFMESAFLCNMFFTSDRRSEFWKYLVAHGKKQLLSRLLREYILIYGGKIDLTEFRNSVCEILSFSDKEYFAWLMDEPNFKGNPPAASIVTGFDMGLVYAIGELAESLRTDERDNALLSAISARVQSENELVRNVVSGQTTVMVLKTKMTSLGRLTREMQSFVLGIELTPFEDIANEICEKGRYSHEDFPKGLLEEFIKEIFEFANDSTKNAGRRIQAREALERFSNWQEEGCDVYTAWACRYLGRIYANSKDCEKTDEYFGRAVAYVARLGLSENANFRWIAKVSYFDWARSMSERMASTGDSEIRRSLAKTGIRNLNESVRYGMNADRYEVLFWSADFYRESGDYGKALEYLGKTKNTKQTRPANAEKNIAVLEGRIIDEFARAIFTSETVLVHRTLFIKIAGADRVLSVYCEQFLRKVTELANDPANAERLANIVTIVKEVVTEKGILQPEARIGILRILKGTDLTLFSEQLLDLVKGAMGKDANPKRNEKDKNIFAAMIDLMAYCPIEDVAQYLESIKDSPKCAEPVVQTAIVGAITSIREQIRQARILEYDMEENFDLSACLANLKMLETRLSGGEDREEILYDARGFISEVKGQLNAIDRLIFSDAYKNLSGEELPAGFWEQKEEASAPKQGFNECYPAMPERFKPKWWRSPTVLCVIPIFILPLPPWLRVSLIAVTFIGLAGMAIYRGKPPSGVASGEVSPFVKKYQNLMEEMRRHRDVAAKIGEGEFSILAWRERRRERIKALEFLKQAYFLTSIYPEKLPNIGNSVKTLLEMKAMLESDGLGAYDSAVRTFAAIMAREIGFSSAIKYFAAMALLNAGDSSVYKTAQDMFTDAERQESRVVIGSKPYYMRVEHAGKGMTVDSASLIEDKKDTSLFRYFVDIINNLRNPAQKESLPASASGDDNPTTKTVKVLYVAFIDKLRGRSASFHNDIRTLQDKSFASVSELVMFFLKVVTEENNSMQISRAEDFINTFLKAGKRDLILFLLRRYLLSFREKVDARDFRETVCRLCGLDDSSYYKWLLDIPPDDSAKKGKKKERKEEKEPLLDVFYDLGVVHALGELTEHLKGKSEAGVRILSDVKRVLNNDDRLVRQIVESETPLSVCEKIAWIVKTRASMEDFIINPFAKDLLIEALDYLRQCEYPEISSYLSDDLIGTFIFKAYFLLYAFKGDSAMRQNVVDVLKALKEISGAKFPEIDMILILLNGKRLINEGEIDTAENDFKEAIKMCAKDAKDNERVENLKLVCLREACAGIVEILGKKIQEEPDKGTQKRLADEGIRYFDMASAVDMNPDAMLSEKLLFLTKAGRFSEMADSMYELREKARNPDALKMNFNYFIKDFVEELVSSDNKAVLSHLAAFKKILGDQSFSEILTEWVCFYSAKSDISNIVALVCETVLSDDVTDEQKVRALILLNGIDLRCYEGRLLRTARQAFGREGQDGKVKSLEVLRNFMHMLKFTRGERTLRFLELLDKRSDLAGRRDVINESARYIREALSVTQQIDSDSGAFLVRGKDFNDALRRYMPRASSQWKEFALESETVAAGEEYVFLSVVEIRKELDVAGDTPEETLSSLNSVQETDFAEYLVAIEEGLDNQWQEALDRIQGEELRAETCKDLMDELYTLLYGRVEDKEYGYLWLLNYIENHGMTDDAERVRQKIFRINYDHNKLEVLSDGEKLARYRELVSTIVTNHEDLQKESFLDIREAINACIYFGNAKDALRFLNLIPREERNTSWGVTFATCVKLLKYNGEDVAEALSVDYADLAEELEGKEGKEFDLCLVGMVREKADMSYAIDLWNVAYTSELFGCLSGELAGYYEKVLEHATAFQEIYFYALAQFIMIGIGTGDRALVNRGLSYVDKKSVSYWMEDSKCSQSIEKILNGFLVTGRYLEVIDIIEFLFNTTAVPDSERTGLVLLLTDAYDAVGYNDGVLRSYKMLFDEIIERGTKEEKEAVHKKYYERLKRLIDEGYAPAEEAMREYLPEALRQVTAAYESEESLGGELLPSEKKLTVKFPYAARIGNGSVDVSLISYGRSILVIKTKYVIDQDFNDFIYQYINTGLAEDLEKNGLYENIYAMREDGEFHEFTNLQNEAVNAARIRNEIRQSFAGSLGKEAKDCLDSGRIVLPFGYADNGVRQAVGFVLNTGDKFVLAAFRPNGGGKWRVDTREGAEFNDADPACVALSLGMFERYSAGDRSVNELVGGIIDFTAAENKRVRVSRSKVVSGEIVVIKEETMDGEKYEVREMKVVSSDGVVNMNTGMVGTFFNENKFMTVRKDAIESGDFVFSPPFVFNVQRKGNGAEENGRIAVVNGFDSFYSGLQNELLSIMVGVPNRNEVQRLFRRNNLPVDWKERLLSVMKADMDIGLKRRNVEILSAVGRAIERAGINGERGKFLIVQISLLIFNGTVSISNSVNGQKKIMPDKVKEILGELRSHSRRLASFEEAV